MDVKTFRFRSEPCAALLQAWRSWRGDKLLPLRDEVDLQSITELLPAMLVFDIVGDRDVRVRLAGTEVVERLGMDPTGINYIAAAPKEIREERWQLMSAIAMQPCAAWAIYVGNYARGGSMPYEALSLPVAVPDGNPRVFTVVSMLQDVQFPDTYLGAGLGEHNIEFSHLDIGAGVPGGSAQDSSA